jgi:Fe-Mn family superoxide dismutase
MAADGGTGPDGALAGAIEAAFESVTELKRRLGDAAVRCFGSGWAWVVHDGTGLAITSTLNQDSPLMHGHTPLLGVDVWEHAYYLKYQNRRADYIEAWWNVIDWARFAARYEAVGRMGP